MAAVKVTGGLAVDAARVAAGGVVVKTAEEASLQAATWAAVEAAGGTFFDAATVKAVEGAGGGTVEAAQEGSVNMRSTQTVSTPPGEYKYEVGTKSVVGILI